jgi:polysaccharide biosynthesis protein PslH
MKVLWLSHVVPYPPKGGVLMRSYYLSSGLAKNFTVDLAALIQPKLITPFFSNYDEGLEEARKHLHKIFNQVYLKEMDHSSTTASKILAIKSLFSSIPYSVAWHYSSTYKNLIRELLRKNNYDLIHVDTLGLYQFVENLTSTPMILDHHNIESAMMLRRAHKTKNIFLKLYFFIESYKIRFYEKKIAPKFMHHITCSQDDLFTLKSLVPTINATEIPNPASRADQFSTREIKTSFPRALFIGGLDWYPNQDAIEHFLGDLAPSILNHCSDLHIDIIGKNPSSKILLLAKGIENVKIHGYVDSIASFYERSTIFICPIRDGGGTKLKVIDAMMHKQVVIGYPEAFEGLAVTDGIHAIICNSPEEFVKKFLYYITDGKTLNEMADRAFQHASTNYASDVVTSKITALYSKLVNKEQVS